MSNQGAETMAARPLIIPAVGPCYRSDVSLNPLMYPGHVIAVVHPRPSLLLSVTRPLTLSGEVIPDKGWGTNP